MIFVNHTTAKMKEMLITAALLYAISNARNLFVPAQLILVIRSSRTNQPYKVIEME